MTDNIGADINKEEDDNDDVLEESIDQILLRYANEFNKNKNTTENAKTQVSTQQKIKEEEKIAIETKQINETSKRKSRWGLGPSSSQISTVSISDIKEEEEVKEEISNNSLKRKEIDRDEEDDCENTQRVGFGFASSSSSSNLNKDLAQFQKSSSSTSSNSFEEQMKEAAERAKRIAMQIKPPSLSSSNSQFDSMTPEQRKQFAEQKELQEIYDIMMVRRRELENIAAHQLKHAKREYDSDEEEDAKVSGGTWEHKLRKAEMEATRDWATKLTDMAENKHHIGDFLPPHELKKFMETYKSLKEGRTPDLSDYKDFKLSAENLGFKLLQKLGWQQGQGLGKANQGILDPVNKGSISVDNTGLGASGAVAGANPNPNRDDSDFDQYRKRMMLAYKFRPNPMNNPRRPYY